VAKCKVAGVASDNEPSAVTENTKPRAGLRGSSFKGNIEAAKAALANKAIWWIPGSLLVSGTPKGTKAIFEDFFGQAHTLFEPNSLSIQVRNAIGEGDYVAVEWVARGKTV
jgi:ketosteroid isomerase-like protein